MKNLQALVLAGLLVMGFAGDTKSAEICGVEIPAQKFVGKDIEREGFYKGEWEVLLVNQLGSKKTRLCSGLQILDVSDSKVQYLYVWGNNPDMKLSKGYSEKTSPLKENLFYFEFKKSRFLFEFKDKSRIVGKEGSSSIEYKKLN
ncbi:MAG: hypothetical protein AAB597_02040 [Patescibacteria group bacterium]